MSHLDFLNEHFPMRRTYNQKWDFTDYIIKELKSKGIEARIEQTNDGKNNNLIVGDPTTAKAIFTAHYDTPMRSLFPNIMIPKSFGIFYLYQFVPVIFLLAISIAAAYLVGITWLNDDRAYMLSFLVLYYGGFFLMMRAFKNPNNYNDNTSGVSALLTIIDELEAEELSKAAFIFFDNEEKGKKGSAAYVKDHKEQMKDKFLVNFDCVGNGEHIIFIAQKDAVDSNELEILKDSFADEGRFKVDFATHKQAQSNSDHKNFAKGVACVACKKSKSGIFYTPYIHTPRDIVADNANIAYLSKNTVEFIKKL